MRHRDPTDELSGGPLPAAPAEAAPGPQRDDGRLRTLPVLPLNDMVLFPSMIAPLVVNTKRSMKLVEDASNGDRLFIAVLQREGDIPDDAIVPAQLHATGCVARTIRMLRFPDDTLRVLVQGQHRCRISGFEGNDSPYLRARFETLKDDLEDGIAIEALARNASQRFQEVITLSPTLPEELKVALFNMEDAAKLSDLIAANLNMTIGERQALLEMTSARARLERITVLINREREVLRLGNEIQSRVSETFSKSQREYFLREQLKQIRSELGEADSQTADSGALTKRIEEAKLPPDTRAVADKELARLAVIPAMSPEHGVIRTYLEWLADMPWDARTEDHLDLRAARKILDGDHFGLARVKERILEFLAVLKLRSDLKGPILCFAGPPGVGKTSLGQSIARALGRKFVRMSLGGVHDEAEIRGHRRTYIGAMPGRILQGLRRAGTRNPVFMLDEIDKIGQDFRGDPSSALLEVLDPEQNRSFQDHYLDVAFDLSQTLFIATANVLDTIPAALRDRMEVLDIAGYTRGEKLHIARRHLVPKQIDAHGLKPAQTRFADAALEGVIDGYTREAGVRNLEREIASLCRKAARAVADRRARRVTVDPARVRRWLGSRRFEPETAERRAPPGVATGLAWTPTGGDILFVEATQMPGKGRLVLTGLLGDAMKESAQAALSFVRSRGASLGLPEDFAEKHDLHIHVPSGSIPKDGPSAGLAIVAAIVSLLTRRPVPADLAMTGEITLRGRVLPVGGVKEKVLAAARAGIRRLLLPVRNADDLKDVPPDIRKTLAIHRVRHIDAALHRVFPETAPTSNEPAAGRRSTRGNRS